MKVSTIKWPESAPVGFDITDFFTSGGIKANFKKLLDDATPITLEDIHSYHSSHISPGGQYQRFIPKIDQKLLTKALRRFLKAVSTTTDAPDEFLLVSHAAKWGGAVGNKIYFQAPDKKLRPNVWIPLFAGSSVARKSTSLFTAGFPYRMVQKYLDDRYSDEFREYSSEHDRWEELNQEAGEDNPEPQIPARKTLLVTTDFSDAGFYMLMKDNPVSGVIVTGEFADLHHKIHREWTSLSSDFLNAFDGERMLRMTRRGGCEIIPEPTFSINAATTFANFNKVFTSTEAENGFLARMFPVVVSSPTKARKNFLRRDQLDHDFHDQMENQIINWLDFDGDIPLVLSNKVEKMFDEWETAFVEESQRKYGDILIPSIERMVAGCIKVAMIFQSVEIDDPAGLNELVLETDTLKCAQMFMENVFLPSMYYLHENRIVMTVDAINEERIITLLRKNGNSMDRSKLRKKSRLPSNELDKNIESLVRQYKIKVTVEGIDREQGGGSPRTIYTLIGD